jgi:hypothetical protein
VWLEAVPMRLRSFLLFTAPMSAFVLAAVGCGAEGGPGDPFVEVDNGFESDDPSGRAASGGSSSGASADSAAAPPKGDESAGDAQRAVQEADIIKVDGDRLYALSKYGGLAIVDIASPDRMKLLGRKRIDGMPFEMYVENGRAFVMLNEFGRWIHEDGNPYGRWVQTSEILAFDVTNPAAIAEISHFDVPGTIADSRLVGNTAYVVTYEDGYCWGCQAKPATIVTSFDVGAQITKRDQLVFTSPTDGYASWQRSVSATNERLYIAGPEWSWTPGALTASSVIQVVDITDPTGKLVKGADIAVEGQINSRWQMDEHAGVLRVVSQFGNGWGAPGQVNPKVQTFTVTSSKQITPLGSTELVLPRPEQLRSVRFDGTRAYAITAERTDPLFTIDLSNPAHPKQMGELEMPGWIFHMEPRGDRLIGFGYDDTNWQANLAVSLFDVSDLSKPTMLKRVSFGSGWGHVAEDQDRIHKAVRVLDDQGMILVPFASYPRWNGNECEEPKSGIQIIDYGRDDLALRGIAPQWGMPRRAFVAKGRLVAMSDRNVTTFDITSRDNPTKTGELDLSNPAYRLAELPSHVASITSDWWNGEVMLSLTPKENADDAVVTSKLSLASLAPPDKSCCGGKYAWTSWYEARLFANGHVLYVTVPVYTYDQGTRGGKLIAASIDVSNPAKPSILGKAETPFADLDASKGGWYGGHGFWDGWSLWSYYGGMQASLVGSGQAVVQLGAKLAYIENAFEPIEVQTRRGTHWDRKVHRRVHVVDFGVPAQPKTFVLDLPESIGSSPLHVFHGTVLTSRWVKSTKNPDKVRFFVDRIDLRGATPTLLSSVNTPGSLVLADEASNRFVTTDYYATRLRVPADIADDYRAYQYCREKLGWRGWFDWLTEQCIVVTRDFKLSDVADTRVTLRHTLNPPSQNISGVQIADDRVYVTRHKVYDWSRADTRTSHEPAVIEDGGLWAIGGIRAGQLAIVSEMVGDAEWPLAAHGTKVTLYTPGGLAIWDTATPKPTLLSETNLRGWGYSSHVLMSDHRAIASLGEWGLQTIQY